MKAPLASWSEAVYCLMRLVLGFTYSCHGAQKLFGVLGGHASLGQPRDLIGGIIEFVGGVLIAVGLQAGWAAFIASGEMAVAYFTVHARQGFFPIVNKGELAVVYCFIFLFISSRGSGLYSVDGLLFGRSSVSTVSPAAP
ncbi:MAG TPA: DoxX family protein [Terriglobales bacterium]|nr:DoxX family protein [Terriglobales bacterium]